MVSVYILKVLAGNPAYGRVTGASTTLPGDAWLSLRFSPVNSILARGPQATTTEKGASNTNRDLGGLHQNVSLHYNV